RDRAGKIDGRERRRGRLGSLDRLLEGVPLIAVGASPEPLRGDVAALLAGVSDAGLCHGRPSGGGGRTADASAGPPRSGLRLSGFRRAGIGDRMLDVLRWGRTAYETDLA